ncbi:MAG: hypothetical protein QUS09_01160 [Methanotrichaceae archaeon]|nr:hypothetical protein [Methanotrichaceae archaeon]
MIVPYPKYGGTNLSRLRIPWMIAATVVAAIFVMVAGLSIGADTTPALEHPALEHPALGILILSDVEPHGDNEHFGVANVGTIEVDLNGYYVAIDDGSSARLPSYNLQPGEEG